MNVIMNKREKIEELLLTEPQPDHLASQVLDLVDEYAEEIRRKADNLLKTVCGLYYRYKKTSDSDIRDYLKDVKIVVQEHKGLGTIFGYYPLSETALAKILEKPRNVSLTFDAIETENTPIPLIECRKFTFLVKSTSRFFLKPDIGEVLDAAPYRHELRGETIRAICIMSGSHEVVPDTDGEHFLMQAVLLIDPPTKEEVEQAVKDLHELVSH
jgi:hypothetical protein